MFTFKMLCDCYTPLALMFIHYRHKFTVTRAVTLHILCSTAINYFSKLSTNQLNLKNDINHVTPEVCMVQFIAGYGVHRSKHHLLSSWVPHFHVSFNKLVYLSARMPTLTWLKHTVMLHSRYIFALVKSAVTKYKISQWNSGFHKAHT